VGNQNYVKAATTGNESFMRWTGIVSASSGVDGETLLIRTLVRSFYYFRVGYGTYLSLPLTIISFCTTIYYLAIQNIPALKALFPGFLEFAVTLVALVYPVSAAIGWFHFKGGPIFKAEQDIIAESNPYSIDKLTPITIPLWKYFIALGREAKIDKEIVDELEAIIKKSC